MYADKLFNTCSVTQTILNTIKRNMIEQGSVAKLLRV